MNEWTAKDASIFHGMGEQMVRLYIKDLGLKPSRIFQTTKLYNAVAWAELASRIAHPRKRGAKRRYSADQIASLIRDYKAGKGIHMGHYTTLCKEVFELIEERGIKADGSRFSTGQVRELYRWDKVKIVAALFGCDLTDCET